MKKWLFVEIIFLATAPTLLALYSAPVLLLAIIEAIFPISTDQRGFLGRFFDLLPNIGGIFSISLVWMLALSVIRGRSFRLGFRFFLGLFGGLMATYKIFLTTNITTVLAFCIPIWILVVHLIYINKLNGEHVKNFW
ncbi:hypothetical protein ISP15_16075 [Dyella jejuensis]|uniref:Uncharacterized protein n=1 Tax=Dyella jejuensis TaxID=1432009 RepID=A0ABW8JL80_9GAMM